MRMVNFDRLLNANTWTNVLYIGVGFLAAVVIENVAQGNTPDTEIPREAFGMPVLLLAGGSGKMRYVGLGGGLHVAGAVADRFDVMDTVEDIGA